MSFLATGFVIAGEVKGYAHTSKLAHIDRLETGFRAALLKEELSVLSEQVVTFDVQIHRDNLVPLIYARIA